jgi:predicted ester cyclase
MSSANKDLVRRLFEEVFNGKNFALCDEIVSESYVENAIAPFQHDAPGTVAGPAHMHGVVEWLIAQFPDIRMTVESLVADGDTVAALILSEGTNLGKLNGVVPPTGRKFSSYQSHWYRVEDGKLVEHWATRDDLTAMLQLGVLQPPGPPV